MEPVLQIVKLSKHPTCPMRASKGAAGLDLSSAEYVVIPANGKGLVSTDLQMAIPEGCSMAALHEGIIFSD